MRWLTAALLVPSIAFGAELVVGKVVSIADGDTLTILDSARLQHRIRLDEQAVEYRAAYASAESAARSAGLGLWGATAPMPPWEWRVRQAQALSQQFNTTAGKSHERHR